MRRTTARPSLSSPGSGLEGQTTLKAVLIALAFAVPTALAVFGVALGMRGDLRAAQSKTLEQIVRLLGEVSSDPQGDRIGLMEKAMLLLKKGSATHGWSSAALTRITRVLPGADPRWPRQRVNSYGDFLVHLVEVGNLSDGWFAARIASLLRSLRHSRVVRDLRENAEAPGHSGGLEEVLKDPEERLKTHLIKELRSVYWQLGRILETRFQTNSSAGKIQRFTREERKLVEELAGYSLLQGEWEEAARKLLIGGSGLRRRLQGSGKPRDVVEVYRWIIELSGHRLSAESAEALQAERANLLEGAPEGELGLMLRLACSAMSDLEEGRYRRAFIRARRVLRELDGPAGPISAWLARRSAVIAVRGALAEAAHAVRPVPRAGKLTGERAVVLLIDAGRLYGELKDPAGLQKVREALKSQGEDALALYGLALLEALEKNDRARLRALLVDPRSEKLLARSAWKRIASGSQIPRRSQEILVDLARIWDALGEGDQLGDILVALAESRQSERDEAYRLYVESLYVLNKGLWSLACKKLEKLHRFIEGQQGAGAVSGEAGEEIPGLSLASIGPLYRLAWEKKQVWEAQASLLGKAQELVERLFLPPDFDSDPESAFEAAMALTEAYAKYGTFHQLTKSLETFTSSWEKWVHRYGPSPFLELEFIRVVDSCRRALDRVIAAFSVRTDATLFTEGKALLRHLRRLLNAKDAYKLQEAQLCEREAERLGESLRNAPPALRPQLRKACAERFLEAAQNAASAGADPLWVGELFLLGGDPAKAVPLLKEAMRDTTGNDGGRRAAFLLGRALQRLGRDKEALKIFAGVTGWGKPAPGTEPPAPRDRLLPLYFEALLQQGRSLIRLKRWEAADAVFAYLYLTLREDNPVWRRALYLRGKAKLLQAVQTTKGRRDLLDQVISIFEEFRQRFPGPTGVEEPSGSGVDILDRTERDLVEALQLRAEDPAQHLKAIALARKVADRLEKSLPRLSSAGKKLLLDVLLRLADITFELGRREEALRWYQKAARYAAGSAHSLWIYFQLGRCAASLGRYREAKAFLEYGRRLLGHMPIGELVKSAPGDDPRAIWEKRFLLVEKSLAVSKGAPGLNRTAQGSGGR